MVNPTGLAMKIEQEEAIGLKSIIKWQVTTDFPTLFGLAWPDLSSPPTQIQGPVAWKPVKG